MKRFLIVCAVALSLGGCAAGTKLGNLIEAVTTTISNPIGVTEVHRVKNVYALGLKLFDEYRTYCWSAPYETLMKNPVAQPVCANRRAAVRAMWKARRNAKAAIVAAEIFVADNPTLNAATALDAAWKAVSDFQSANPLPK